MSSIKKNFLYSSVLTTANYIFPFITYPYVSRVLGVTNIGVCNFVDSIINYFILFSMLGIGTVGIREIARHKGNITKLNETFNSLFTINFITTAVVLVALLISIYVVPQLHEYRELMYIGAFKLFFNFLLIEWFYKGLEDFRFITIRTLIVKSLYVIGCFIFIRKSSDYLVYYLLITLMIIINAIINIYYARHWIHFSFKSFKKSLYIKPILILGLYFFLTSMYTSFNVVFLGFVAGETEVGYYTTATKLYAIILALFTAFTGVMLPRMSALVGSGQMEEFKRLYGKSINTLFSFSFPLVVFSVIWADVIIRIIAGNGYEGAILPMKIVMPLVFVIGYEQILVVQTLMPLKKDRQILISSIVGATIGLLLNLILVPLFKSIGSSIVWVVSELVVLCCAQYCITKDIDNAFPFMKLIKYILYYIPLAIVLMLIHSLDINLLISFVIGGIVLIIYVYIFVFYVIKDGFIIGLTNKVVRGK